mgnify:CR=1 FL=1|jgi:hypothetical protein|tara:strand:- start:56 stop:490 length:435 start_codon:yes stop_codon:yes gene_type:complete
MAVRRTQIVEALVSDIHTNVTLILPANVTRQMVFLNEINDFPFVCMLVEPETRFHYGAGRKLATLAISLRGYVFDGDSGENIDLAEDLGMDIETAVIQPFAQAHRDLGVEFAGVQSFRTDEGLMSPYGVMDQTITITYEVDELV